MNTQPPGAPLGGPKKHYVDPPGFVPPSNAWLNARQVGGGAADKAWEHAVKSYEEAVLLLMRNVPGAEIRVRACAARLRSSMLTP